MYKQKDEWLRDFFQECFSDYEHPVKNTGWVSLEKEISQVKPNVHKSFWMIATSIAAGLTLVIGFLFFLKKPTENQPEVLVMMDEKNIHANTKEIIEENYPVSEQIAEKKFVQTIAEKKVSSENIFESQLFAAPDTITFETIAENASPETVQKSFQKEDGSSQLYENEDLRKYKPALSHNSHKKNIQFSLAGKNILAINNSMNLNEIRNIVYFRSFRNASNIGINIACELQSQDELIGIDYKLPINLSLLVKKNLFQNWGIETGISYTYLASNETWRSHEYNMVATNTVALHYLGIPVKISYSLLQNKQWAVYLSGGGMLEKCINGNILTTESTRNFKMRRPLNIPEWQLSWMGNIGIGYRIYSPVSIFVEPGFNYFPNDGSSVMTIRKDKPFTFNLQAGLRFDF